MTVQTMILVVSDGILPTAQQTQLLEGAGNC